MNNFLRFINDDQESVNFVAVDEIKRIEVKKVGSNRYQTEYTMNIFNAYGNMVAQKHYPDKDTAILASQNMIVAINDKARLNQRIAIAMSILEGQTSNANSGKPIDNKSIATALNLADILIKEANIKPL